MAFRAVATFAVALSTVSVRPSLRARGAR